VKIKGRFSHRGTPGFIPSLFRVGAAFRWKRMTGAFCPYLRALNPNHFKYPDIMPPQSWSISQYFFTLHLGKTGPVGRFLEVEGLEPDSPPADTPGTFRIADRKAASILTLRRGIFDGADFEAWLNDMQAGKILPTTMAVDLTDETNQTLMSWKLVNARPLQLDGMFSEDGGVKVETLELSFGGIEIVRG